MKTLRVAIGIAAVLGTAACSHVPVPMEPVTLPPIKQTPKMTRQNGTILQDAREFSLFEDSRPMYAGDTVIVLITEKTEGSKKSSTATNRGDTTSIGFPKIGLGIPGGTDLKKLELEASSTNKFAGGGETTASNLFSGTITATVTEVLPNGHLMIAGKKQINIHNETETLIFTGIVNPRYIMSNGVVSSLNVSEVRVQYTGGGQINESQFKGFLSRIFTNISPF